MFGRKPEDLPACAVYWDRKSMRPKRKINYKLIALIVAAYLAGFLTAAIPLS